MPNLTIYLDNETYIKFLQLADDTRSDVRERFIKMVKQEIKRGDLK